MAEQTHDITPAKLQSVLHDLGASTSPTGAPRMAEIPVSYLRAIIEFALLPLQPKPLDSYHEDMGPVLWWHFPIVEEPYVGKITDEKFNFEWHQWWTPLPDASNGHWTHDAIEAIVNAELPEEVTNA